MDYNHFFNFYGYETQDGWIGRQTQLKAAGYDDSKVENTFGKGWCDNGAYPTNVDKKGEFMSRNEQLADINPNLDINNYELVYGKGFVSKTKPKYLTFTANEDDVELAFFFNRNAAVEEQQNPNISFQKSLDGGLTWEEHTIGVYGPDDGDISNLDIITLNEGESVMFKGVNSENFTVGDPENIDGVFVGFYLDGSAVASGDITSLINGVGGDATVQFMQFYCMFDGCTGLTEAPTLPSTTLADYCYAAMFQDCTSLISAPTLPATTLAENCYQSMFSGCTGLTEVPALPATTLADYCYDFLFQGCTGITSYDVATLNTSQDTFNNNSSCTSFTIHADTPPTIGSTTISGLKADCIIYVPAASVDAYKAAKYWPARAEYIQAIQP